MSVPPTGATTPVPAAPKVIDLTYNLTVWSLAEQAKPKTKRVPQSRVVDGKSDAEFVDVLDSFKMEIVRILFPAAAVVPDDAYKLLYSIPRRVPHEVPLVTEADYTKMIKVLTSMATPNVRIVAYEAQKVSVSANSRS